MQAGRVSSQSDLLVACPAEHILVFRPALGKWLKAGFGYDDRKGVGACDRGPSRLGEDDEIREESVPSY